MFLFQCLGSLFLQMDFATALTMFCLVSPNKGYGQGLNCLPWSSFVGHLWAGSHSHGCHFDLGRRSII